MLKLPSSVEIKQFFPNHRIEIVKKFLLLLGCIYKSGSVNLNLCKRKAPDLLGKKHLNLSNIYARFIRFFKMEDTSVFSIGIALLIFNTVKDIQENTYIILDRTNWQLGKKKINILQLGIGLFNYSMIPILGIPLGNKKGNSSEAERIGLLNLFLGLSPFIPTDSIVIGDREFIGKKWFAHIIKAGLSFVFRVRKDDYLLDIALSAGLSISKLNRKIKRKVKANGFYFQEFKMDGNTYYYLVVWDKASKKGQDRYVRLVSNKKEIKQILEAYKYRWEIEVYFRKTKSDGFKLEDINFTDDDKIMVMASIVGYLYTIVLVKGMEQDFKKPQKMQYFINRKTRYKRISYFTQGLDALASAILKLTDFISFIRKKIKKKVWINTQFLQRFKGKSIPIILKNIKSV